MTYSTVMVNLELGCSNAGVMSAAGDLAERFGASVVGIAACHPMPVIYTDGFYIPQELIEQDRAQINSDLKAAAADTPSDLIRRINPGDLLMQMGRPVLVVPAAAVSHLDRVLVAWKDCR